MKTPLSKILGSAVLATGVAVSLIAAPAQAGNKPVSNNTQDKKVEVPVSTAPDTGNKPVSNNTQDKKVEVPVSTAPAETGGTLGTCSTTDLLLGTVKATDCAGAFEGNDTGNKGTLQDKLNAGLFKTSFTGNQTVSWSLTTKSDDGNLFGFDAQEGLSQGNWGFTEKLATNTFVVSLKSSTGYSAYLFKDYDWNKGLTGVFNTIGVSTNSNNGTAQALSHASLFSANITTTPADVPEPATLVGLGLAFGGMLVSRRRLMNK